MVSTLLISHKLTNILRSLSFDIFIEGVDQANFSPYKRTLNGKEFLTKFKGIITKFKQNLYASSLKMQKLLQESNQSQFSVKTSSSKGNPGCCYFDDELSLTKLKSYIIVEIPTKYYF